MEELVIYIGTFIYVLILIISCIIVRNRSKLDMDKIPKKIVQPIFIGVNPMETDVLIRGDEGKVNMFASIGSVIGGRRLGYIKEERFLVTYCFEDNRVGLLDESGNIWDLESFDYLTS